MWKPALKPIGIKCLKPALWNPGEFFFFQNFETLPESLRDENN